MVGATGLAVVIAALAELAAELRGAEPNIASFGGAVWWTMTTITTVGYGDRCPTALGGRLRWVVGWSVSG